LYTKHDNCVTLERTCTVMGLGYLQGHLQADLWVGGVYNCTPHLLKDQAVIHPTYSKVSLKIALQFGRKC